MDTAGDGVTVIVWWKPDCGFLHVETDPVTVPIRCPDAVEEDPE